MMTRKIARPYAISVCEIECFQRLQNGGLNISEFFELVADVSIIVLILEVADVNHLCDIRANTIEVSVFDAMDEVADVMVKDVNYVDHGECLLQVVYIDIITNTNTFGN